MLPLALEVSGEMDFGELIVGTGTLALAGITGWLARTTRQSVVAAQDSVEAMAMPYVIAVPRDERPTVKFAPCSNKPGGTLELCLSNLGSGPGVVIHVRLVCHGKQLLEKLPRSVPIGAGDKFSGADVHPTSWPELEKDALAATLEIEYLHSNGRRYLTESKVEIKGNELTCVTFQRSLLVEEPAGV